MKNKVLIKAVEIAHAFCPTHRQSGVRAAHVAILVKKNKIVKIGWNKNRTHPKTKEYPYVGSRPKYNRINVGIHAELDVMMKCGKEDLRGHDMIVLRVDGTGKLNNSRPCIGCMGAIKQFGVDNIYYSNCNGQISYECA